MTHLIHHWHTPNHVHALQTTNTLDNEVFDIHPEYSNQQQLEHLSSKFNLPHQPKFLRQVHGGNVIEYTAQTETGFNHQADACFTRATNVICGILTADCLPVLMTDTKGSFVAAVHCGWRSLYADILSITLNIINPRDEVLVWFGPCIQQAQYEVGEDFVDNYLSKHPNAASAFKPVSNNKSFASLYQLAESQLNKLNINNISKSHECTYLDSNYYSWRENQTPQRMASLIWLAPK